MERQLEFSFREGIVSENVAPQVREAVNELLSDPSKYASRKRVSLVYEGSLDGRPKITGPQASKDFFGRYWLDNPGNDQERFVVACLNTKNVVQSVVEITVGTPAARIVAACPFCPLIAGGSVFKYSRAR